MAIFNTDLSHQDISSDIRVVVVRFSTHSLDMYLGNGMDLGIPYRLRVVVSVGTVTGNDSPTRHLQNKCKNIISQLELTELQSFTGP